MKKSFLISSFIFLTICLSAQSTLIGLRSGMNLANQTGLSVSGSGFPETNRFAPLKNLSLFTQIKISNKFALQLELGLLQKGFQIDYSRDTFISFNGQAVATSDYNVIYDYAEFSSLGLYSVFSNKDLQINLLIGPSIGYAIRRRSVNSNSSWSGYDLKLWGVNRIDFGITGGVDALIPLGSGYITVDIRYTEGLVNIIKEFLNVRNQVLGISFGYAIPLSKRTTE